MAHIYTCILRRTLFPSPHHPGFYGKAGQRERKGEIDNSHLLRGGFGSPHSSPVDLAKALMGADLEDGGVMMHVYHIDSPFFFPRDIPLLLFWRA